MDHHRLKITCGLCCLLVVSVLTGVSSPAASLQDNLIADRKIDINQYVTNIVKDDEGFIWISSRLGIARYDGRNLKHYQLTKSDIVQDEDGRYVYIRRTGGNQLWVFSDSGKIYWYDAGLDTFILKFDVRRSTGATLVNDILIGKDNALWIATSTGLLKCNLSAEAPEYTFYREGVHVNFLSLMGSATLLAGTTKGVELIPLNSAAGNAGADLTMLCKGTNVKSVWYDEAGQLLWIGSFSSGLFVWDLKQHRFADYPFLKDIPDAPVMVIRKLDAGNLLIGTDGRGVFKIDLEKQRAKPFLADDGNYQGGIRGNGVYDLLIDENRIWVGTYTGGVSLIKYNQDYQWVRHEPYNGQSVLNNHIYGILEDKDGDVWYATNSGVSLFETKTKRWRHFFRNKNTFLTLTEDREGTIWCGGFSTGLCRIDKRTGKEHAIGSFQNNGQLECVYASAIDRDGDIWIGSLYSSLMCFSAVNGRQVRKEYDIGQVRSILPLNGDTLFLATSNGFYLLDKATGGSKHYFGSPANYGVVSNSFIYAAVAVGNEIWFGTDGGGLNCFNRRTGKVVNFSTYNGLPSNYIYGIVKQGQKLWVSTGNGLFCFDPQSKKMLFKADNLPVNDFLLMSFARFDDGRLAFGSTGGALIFDPVKLEREQTRKADENTALHLTDFKLSYRSINFQNEPDILVNGIDRTRSVVLKYNQNTFSFGYVFNSLYNAGDYVYSCMLEGFEDAWVSRGGDLSVDYSNIPPGNYRFRVKCLTKDGGITVGERSIGITIKNPVWATAWAKTVYGLLLALLVYWLWRYYWEKVKQRQAEGRIRFFITMAHDIRTPLALISAPLNDLRDEQLSARARKYVDLARHNAAKLNALVTQLLDFHKEDLVTSRLELTVNEMNLYLENKVNQFGNLARDKTILLKLKKSDQAMYCETDVQKLDRIMDNLLSNAVKYTGNNGRIVVSIGKKDRKSDKKIVISVVDNGIGIAKKEQKNIFNQFYRADNAVNSKETGTGIGLMYSRQLAGYLKGDLSFVSEEGKGSTFCLTLPLLDFQPEEATVAGVQAPEETTVPLAEILDGRRYFEEEYKILIVEDNDDMRSYLAHTLSERYKLHQVSSAEEALEFLQRHPVHLVLADVMMPGMHGDELCLRIKSAIETSHIQVILLTAVAERDFVIHSMEYGADAYITKPFDIQTLKLNIHNFLHTRKKMQQHYLTMVSQSRQNLKNGTDDTVAVKPDDMDEEFIRKCIEVINEHIADSGFTINSLSREMAMSRTLFYEKLKVLTNQSPSELIREIRLRKAKALLLTKEHTVNEVAFMTGFTDVKYFSTLFKKYYGVNPSKVDMDK